METANAKLKSCKQRSSSTWASSPKLPIKAGVIFQAGLLFTLLFKVRCVCFAGFYPPSLGVMLLFLIRFHL